MNFYYHHGSEISSRFSAAIIFYCYVEDAVNGSRSADEVRQVWRPPLAAGFKLDVAAAVVIGAVVRNGQGIHVVACAKFLYGSLDFEMAEARALLEGVEKGLFPLEVESDALNVVNLCSAMFSSRYWLLGSDVADVSGFLPLVA
ncbi:hypothetical protein QYF36_007817 [Acer negundo]|nr:hypothetical protein QYF36_007817 [Acer negundo]